MAKPDPVPTFIEVEALAKPLVTTESETAKPLEGDWVDEFLCDREIRSNTKKAYLASLGAFRSGASSEHWAEISDVDA